MAGVRCAGLKCSSAQPGRGPDASGDVSPETCPPLPPSPHLSAFFSRQVFHEQGILFGYRHPQSSATACVLSLFQMTNETLNIWTHLLPFWYLPAISFGSPGNQGFFKTQLGWGGLRCYAGIWGTPQGVWVWSRGELLVMDCGRLHGAPGGSVVFRGPGPDFIFSSSVLEAFWVSRETWLTCHELEQVTYPV